MENNVMNTNSNGNVNESQNTGNGEAGPQPVDRESSIHPAIISELKAGQSMLRAMLGGLLGAAAGAVAWAIVTALTKYQIGYMAIAVGFLAGFMVKKFGQGFEQRFGYVGALWALIGCFAGNILAILIMTCGELDVSFLDLLQMLDADVLVNIIKETFSPMDILFYAIAVYEGYRFSIMTKLEVTNKLHKILSTKAVHS